MRYIAEDATLRFKFNTRRFSTGAPYTLAGTPSLAVYAENSDTQITAGITLTVDYDSVTGLNNVVIDLSASASYAAGKKYEVVIEAGTVDSVSVVGAVVYEFYLHASGGLESLITRALLALPAAAADAAGGLPISDAGGLDLDASEAKQDQIIALIGTPTDTNIATDIANLQATADALPSQADITGGAYAISTNASGMVRIVDGTGTGEIDTLSGTVLLRAATQTQIDDILTDTGTTLQAELDGIQADTEDIQSRLPATLTVDGNMKSDVLRISGSAGTADNLETAFDLQWATSFDGARFIAVLADAVTHGGASALLRLGSADATPAFYVTNSFTTGPAVSFANSATDNSPALLLSGGIGLRLVGTVAEAFDIESTANGAPAISILGDGVSPIAIDIGGSVGLLSDLSIGGNLVVQGDTTLVGAVAANHASNSIVGVKLHGTQSAYTPATAAALAALVSTIGTPSDLGDGATVAGNLTDIFADMGTAQTGDAYSYLTTNLGSLGANLTALRTLVTGYAGPISTDASGMVRIVDGTGTGEIDTSSGSVAVTATSVRSALGLASANLDTQLDAIPTAAENAAALLDLTDGIETGVTPRKAIRAIAAKAMGLISDAGTGTEVVKGIGVATTRGTATVDGSGNITNWALNL